MRPLPFAPVLLALAISLAYAEPATRSVASVEFTPTAAPLSDAERSSITTQSQLVVHYTDGSQRHYPLAYHRLFATTDRFDGRAAGQIADRNNQALKDAAGQLLISDAPDANSLLQPLPGARAGKGKNALHLVTHYEYATSDSLGKEGFWARLPAGMTLTRLDQDKRDGSLSVREVKPISFKDVDGLWVPCAGSLSPWNTHLGSEEYEPDARCVSQPDYRYPSSGKAACTTAPNTLEAMQLYGVSQPNPYDYGLTPEVSVKADGRTSVVKHRALGRQSREKVQVMPDNRTAFQGDDGTYNMLTMFIADKPRDLSSGTLYAAKWQQAGDQDGGTATLAWIRLGHGSDREIEKLAHQYRFDDIFETAPVVVIKTDGKISGYEAPPAGFKQIIAGHNSVNVENLRLKPGMEQAAAFLETRRYAAYQGATTEFDKYEGVALNAREHKVYHAITQIAGGMVDNPADPRNDVRLPANICGAVYEMSTGDGQKDSDGQPIASDWVGTAMRAAVVGKPQGSDAIGNTCDIDGVSRPDNLSYSEKMRVLFIGEDTNRHLNNFLWAYHLDSGKLVRILSLPAGAESTGLQVVDDRNGFAYIMSNYQHAAEFSYPFESWNVSKAAPELAERLSRLIDRRQGAIGYIGGLPRLK